MRIDVWSDIACPWCWLGKHHLEEAVRRLGLQDDVHIEHRAYELRPNRGPTEPARPYLEQKLGGPERLASAHQRMGEMGRAAGIAYNFGDAKLANTFDGHRLVQLAKRHGKGDVAVERLMRAYHGEGIDVASVTELRRLAVDAELPPDEVQEVLSSDRYAPEVRADEAQAAELGITGVPFFVVDGRYGISGAQPVEVFEQALARVRALADEPTQP